VFYAVSRYGIKLPSAVSLTENDVAFVAFRLKMLMHGDDREVDALSHPSESLEPRGGGYL
jgi:hypothetical protein